MTNLVVIRSFLVNDHLKDSSYYGRSAPLVTLRSFSTVPFFNVLFSLNRFRCRWKMPLYELSLILRTLTKMENKVVLKRAAEAIMNEGGIMRKIENLGTRQLPYRMRKDAANYRQGSYFLYQFDSQPELIADLEELYKRDVDIVVSKFVRVDRLEPFQCTLEDELLPPAYRPEVKQMIEEGRKKEPRKQFQFHVDIYPFQ